MSITEADRAREPVTEPATTEAEEPELLEGEPEVLLEEISIDGMCGVY
jgi:mycofactocin precursor